MHPAASARTRCRVQKVLSRSIFIARRVPAGILHRQLADFDHSLLTLLVYRRPPPHIITPAKATASTTAASRTPPESSGE